VIRRAHLFARWLPSMRVTGTAVSAVEPASPGPWRRARAPAIAGRRACGSWPWQCCWRSRSASHCCVVWRCWLGTGPSPPPTSRRWPPHRASLRPRNHAPLRLASPPRTMRRCVRAASSWPATAEAVRRRSSSPPRFGCRW